MKLRTHFFRLSYRFLLRPILFLFHPEKVHALMTSFGALLGRFRLTRAFTRSCFSYQNPVLTQTLHGISFKNPVGLSAGFDKEADLVAILPEVGFGFMEVGSITLHPYKGNVHPWLTRLKKSKAILVNYGLKSEGVEKVLDRFQKRKQPNFPYALSIAKTNCKETNSIEKGVEDYKGCLKRMREENAGAFYVLNISCPNTFGGEPFTEKDSLRTLLQSLELQKMSQPVFVKMPINLPWEKFQELLEVTVDSGASGVVIGNLNKNRKDPAIKDEIPETLGGNVSGKPTWQLSNELISKTYEHYGQKLTIIGVGGIFSAEDAYEKIQRGASLVALVTGMIYQGPQLVSEINQGLVKFLKRDGYARLSDAIGTFSSSK